jgi:inosine/xanthosine triphosphatase
VRVIIGGTFDPLHAGHKSLLTRAVEVAGEDGSIHIGLVTNEYSDRKRRRSITTYPEREKRLREWFKQQDTRARVQINPLDDPYGPSVTGDYDVLVASIETVATAHQVNQERANRGLGPLRIETVPLELAQDLLPISATRIQAGLIDEEGRRTAPLTIAVGTHNPVKLRAVQNAMRRYLPRVPLQLLPMSVDTGVPEQPQDHQAAAGARRRAELALEKALEKGAEYGIGIEAGILRDGYSGVVFDVQHCFIVDTTDYTTHGHGSGFAYPPTITRRVFEEGLTISQAFAPITQQPQIGRYEGAVGWLTKGVLDRTRLTEQAVEAAFVPRIRRDLYDPHSVPH